jgi:hypothetical protein
MWVFFLTFLVIAFFCFQDIREKDLIFLLLGFTLVIVAVFFGQNSKDHSTYITVYEEIIANKVKSPLSLVLISKFVYNFFKDPFFLFLIYASLGVSLKVLAIKSLTDLWFFSLLIYFSYYFFLHDVTQLKAGVASAFFLLSIPAIYEKSLFRFLIFSVIAAFFHFSALILLPFFFIKKDKIQSWYFFLIPVGFIFYFFHINFTSLISLLDIEIILLKYEQYSSLGKMHKINIFNALMIARYIFCAILLWKWKYLTMINKYAPILIKIYIISCFIFIIFSDMPVVSFRLSELVAIVEIILVPFIIYLFNIRVLGKVVVGIIAVFFLFLALFYLKLAGNY